MNRKKLFLMPVFAVAFVLFGGYIVQVLWNHSMPLIADGIHPIDYWTATCLLLLCRLLVGSFNKGGHGGPPWARDNRWERFKQKLDTLDQPDGPFAHMSAEERQRLRDEWKRRCMGWGRNGGGPAWGRNRRPDEDPRPNPEA